MQVTNPTPRPIYASQITGADGKLRNFEIMSGDSVDVDERTAMILGEYGAMVDRSELDPALIENTDPRVEPVVSPWSQHGPGTNERGYVVDEDAAAAHAEMLDGDTSKSMAAMVRVASQVVPTVPADAETVTTGGTESDGGTADTAGDDELKGAALDEALRERSLSTSGTADEKRARVAQYDAEQEQAQAAAASGSSSPADTSPSSSTTSTPTT